MDVLFEIKRKENTVTMIRTFFRHLGESLKSLKRNGWMTLASVSAVTVTLILVGIFLSVILNVAKIAKDIESTVDISVFIDYGTEKEEMEQLKTELEKIPSVENVKFSGREEQLNNLIEKYGDSWKLFDEDDNPLYDVFIVSTKEPEDTKKVQKIAEKLPAVYKADYGGLSSDKIFKISKGIRTWGLVATALLIFVAIFLISNTIRITIISRKREIQIMKLVGAKNGFIRWPFFLEGAWIGLLGAVVPMLMMTFGYPEVSSIVSKILLSQSFSLIPAQDLVLGMNILMGVIGVVIGSIGSIMSMRRFLKI